MLHQGKLRSKEEERYMVTEAEFWTWSRELFLQQEISLSFMHYTDQQFNTEHADSHLNSLIWGFAGWWKISKYWVDSWQAA